MLYLNNPIYFECALHFKKSKLAKLSSINKNNLQGHLRMKEFILVGIFILAIIYWIISSNDKKKMNNMLSRHNDSAALPSNISHSAFNLHESQTEFLSNESKQLAEEVDSLLINLTDATHRHKKALASLSRERVQKKITLKEFNFRSKELKAALTKVESLYDAKLKLRDESFNKLKAISHGIAANPVASKLPSHEVSKTSIHASLNDRADIDFITFDKYFGPNNDSGIAIDRTNKQIALLTPNSRVIVRFADIVSSEVIVDSESIIKTDRVNQISGAVVGGLLTGGIGALVMAMGASKKQIDKVNKIQLKILTTQTHNPIHTILFYHKNSWGIPKSSLEDANKWYDLISVAIKESQVATKNAEVQESASITPSLSDELLKLSNLRSNGLLTDDEFTNAKKKLIAS